MSSQVSLSLNSYQEHDEICQQYGCHMPISHRGAELGLLKQLYLNWLKCL